MRLQIFHRLFDVAFKTKRGVEEISRLSPLLLAMWEQYLEFNDPELREDQRFGHLIAAVLNAKHYEKWVEPETFMFFSTKQSQSSSSLPPSMTEEQYVAFMTAAEAARNSQ